MGQAFHYKIFFLLVLLWLPLKTSLVYHYSSILNNGKGWCPKASHTITKTSSILPCSHIKSLIIPFASHACIRGHTLLIPQTMSQPFLILLSRTEPTILSTWSTVFIPIYSPFTWPHTDSYCFLAFCPIRADHAVQQLVNYYHTPLTSCHLQILCEIIFSLLSHPLIIM